MASIPQRSPPASQTWLATVEAALRLQARDLYRSLVLARHVGANLGSYPLWLACYAATPEVPTAGRAGPSGSIRKAER